MKTTFTDARDLLGHAAQSGRLKMLLSQLRKDYERANISFPLQGDIPAEPDADRILQELRESLYFLLMERFDLYLNLMYAADVPEREFKGVQVTDAVDVATQVTFLLLKREWKKIEFRTR
ncbi:MAG: hypothetical protein ACO20F_06140 [Robiginitalea sp.]|jgi:hypothetical protein